MGDSVTANNLITVYGYGKKRRVFFMKMSQQTWIMFAPIPCSLWIGSYRRQSNWRHLRIRRCTLLTKWLLIVWQWFQSPTFRDEFCFLEDDPGNEGLPREEWGTPASQIIYHCSQRGTPDGHLVTAGDLNVLGEDKLQIPEVYRNIPITKL